MWQPVNNSFVVYPITKLPHNSQLTKFREHFFAEEQAFLFHVFDNAEEWDMLLRTCCQRVNPSVCHAHLRTTTRVDRTLCNVPFWHVMSVPGEKATILARLLYMCR